MFKIDSNTKLVELTRGDIASFEIKATNKDGSFYQFKQGDEITLSIYEKKDYNNLKLHKNIVVTEPGESVSLTLTSEETKLDEIINKPHDYWYEIQLNHEQTIIGYDEDGAKIFRLYPEGVEE